MSSNVRPVSGWIAGVILGLAVVGCRSASDTAAAPEPVEVAPPQGAGTVLVHMRTRHLVLTVSSTATGLRYGVAGRDGRPVAGDLTGSKLQARFPGLYDIYRDSIGRELQRGRQAAASPDAIWDASLHGVQPAGGLHRDALAPARGDYGNPIPLR